MRGTSSIEAIAPSLLSLLGDKEVRSFGDDHENPPSL